MRSHLLITITTDRKCIVKATCINCSKKQNMEVNIKDLEAWDQGKPIQNALPYLSIEEREMLVSGICSDCWCDDGWCKDLH